MKLVCPRCAHEFADAEINVAQDIAYCGACHEAFKVSLLVDDGEAVGFDLARPPRGAWFVRTPRGWRLGATTRSPIAFFIVPFTCVWSGGSLGGIYGSQLMRGEFSLLPSLFGLPFLAGSLLLWTFAAMAAFGRIELALDGDDAELFVGIGGLLGSRRRFRWSDMRRAGESSALMRHPGTVDGLAISLTGKDSISFGTGVSGRRRSYLVAALRKLIAERRHREPLEPGALALAPEGVSDGSLSLSPESGALSEPER